MNKCCSENEINASVCEGFLIKGINGKDGVSPIITVEESTDTSYKLKITNVNGSFITPNLKGEGGAGGNDNYRIEATLDKTTYLLTISLLNGKGEIVSSQSVDFPIESLVVNGSYNQSTKSLVFTLQNGNTISIPIGDIVSGLATTEYVDNSVNSIRLNSGNNVEIKDGVISVLTTNNAEEDNTRPITSAGVNTIVGNIDVLLKLI